MIIWQCWYLVVIFITGFVNIVMVAINDDMAMLVSCHDFYCRVVNIVLVVRNDN